MKSIEVLQDDAVALRRKFHQTPETGFTEFITTYEIYTILKDTDFKLHLGTEVLSPNHRYGVPDEEIIEASRKRAVSYGVPDDFLDLLEGGNTGLVAVLDTGRPGPHIAMRSDIDALPILESEGASHKPSAEGFRSVHENEMHACGHDGHIAIGLAVAKYIHQNASQLTGRFTLIFQPAEEGGRGARSVVEKGWLDDVDYFMSGHLGIHEATAGTVSATTERFLASTKLDVSFNGKSAHSGVEPNAGRNALLAAASASLHLHAIPRHREGATRVNVGTMNAGSGWNVVADHAEIKMETRGETNALNEYMLSEVERILQASALMHGTDYETKFMGTAIGAACDSKWQTLVREANHANPDVVMIRDVLPLDASEDVTYMIDHVQKRGGLATFMIFASPLAAGHHHPAFDFDEAAIRTAVSVYINNINHIAGGVLHESDD
ncbi:amidohydrolase [Salinicoccus cyprini]|uniref:amidohydrolase n=1 Tax=Salinicoccus cyprini TaxID=2493691 RepID=UPI001FEA74B2|nr:amidohydrolase [Salinicoccus cyprini]